MPNQYMQIAIEAAKKGMESNKGGPFGAVVVCNGEVVSVAHNEVLGTNDPTAHFTILLYNSSKSRKTRGVRTLCKTKFASFRTSNACFSVFLSQIASNIWIFYTPADPQSSKVQKEGGVDYLVYGLYNSL